MVIGWHISTFLFLIKNQHKNSGLSLFLVRQQGQCATAQSHDLFAQAQSDAASFLFGREERYKNLSGCIGRNGGTVVGYLYTDTYLGDYPMFLPTEKRQASNSFQPGWMLLSYGKTVTASSTLDGFPAER